MPHYMYYIAHHRRKAKCGTFCYFCRFQNENMKTLAPSCQTFKFLEAEQGMNLEHFHYIH